MKKERKLVDIALLRTPEHNTRIHPETQIKEIRRSLRKWGQYRDLVIDDQSLVLIGNGLVTAMRAENYEKAWAVIVTDISENEKKKLMLADNKTAGLGIDHLENIELLVGELDGDFDIPGFDDEVLSSINAASEEISKAMDDYGKATAENIRKIEANADANAGELEAGPGEAPPRETNAEEAEDGAGRKSVRCPECGAVVWL